MNRLLAVGAGAGSLSSLLVALLSQQLQPGPPSYDSPGLLNQPSGFEGYILDRFADRDTCWDSHFFAARLIVPFQTISCR